MDDLTTNLTSLNEAIGKQNEIADQLDTLMTQLHGATPR
jgi:hypothetical protein